MEKFNTHIFEQLFCEFFPRVIFYDGQPCDFDLGFGLPLGENKGLCQFLMNQF